jgi:hypothetical protein
MFGKHLVRCRQLRLALGQADVVDPLADSLFDCRRAVEARLSLSGEIFMAVGPKRFSKLILRLDSAG